MSGRTSKISAVAYHLPENELTHDELEKRFGSEVMTRVVENSGIKSRKIAGQTECASDLAFEAAKKLLLENNIDKDSIDLLIFSSQTPDYLIPTTACILQDRLGLSKKTAAFDINLGCSQYVYAISIAHSMLVAGLAKRALVLTGDTISKILNPLDRAVVPLFGDAGTATLLDTAEMGNGIVDFELGTDGSGHEYLIWPTSGLRNPKTESSAIAKEDKEGSWRSDNDMQMNGKAIFLFTLQLVPRMIQSLLKRHNLTVDDIDVFVLHQASDLIINTIANKLNIKKEKLALKLSDCGNSGGSTVAVALGEALHSGKIKKGSKVVLAAFGVGLSWGSCLINWQ